MRNRLDTTWTFFYFKSIREGGNKIENIPDSAFKKQFLRFICNPNKAIYHVFNSSVH